MEPNPIMIKKGRNVLISPYARIYCNYLEIGDNVRIDDFCILTGIIKIGSNLHIGCYSFLSGGEGIEIEDFAGISAKVSILSASDDYSGRSLTQPVIPDEYKPGLKKGLVTLRKHSIIGTNSTVMPGVVIGEGCAVGAYSFVKENTRRWSIYAGVPAKYIKERSKNMLELEKEYGISK